MKNKKLKKLPQNEVFEGVVQGHRDGHGFILRDDGQADVYLSSHVMQSVLHHDRVRAVIAGYDRKGRPEGQVLDIIKREDKLIIGRLLKESGVWLVAPEDSRYRQDILIPENGIGDAKVGQVVTVKLTEKPTLHSQPLGHIVEVLGNIDDSGIEIEIAVRKYNVPYVFSEETLLEAQKIPDKVRPVDKRGRVDLTDVPFVTIDGEDARDFDDAVYCEPAKVGKSKGYRLLVAIADVSHYVKPSMAIDDDAYERATSVYFPRRVIPMLPEKLSNGVCSLNPDVERLCLVCDMLITAQGKTYAYQFYPAVIKSHARMTYTEVAAILTNTHGPQAKARIERVQDLLHLYAVYQTLYKAREKRGAIDLDTVETRIIYDHAGRIEKIEPYERTEAHRVIEEAMLAANVCAADFILESKCMGLFRVHEGPTPEKREVLQGYLQALGLNIHVPDDPEPKELQQIAQVTKDRPDAQQIQMMLLRSMQQAIYTPHNSGHFGLAYEAYTHFTSPIRRYPDLLVHRAIKGVLAGKKYKLDDRSDRSNLMPYGQKGQKKADGAKEDKKVNVKESKEIDAWSVAGMHCSANERRADEASRDVLLWLKCSYIRGHLGEEFMGKVSAVTSFGLFVQLDTMYVEGLVHISEIGGDYFHFDEIRQELVGEGSGIRYSLGSAVRVQVSRVDLDSRLIDFRLVNPDEQAFGLLPKKKGLSKNGKMGKSINPEKRGADNLKYTAKKSARKAFKEAKKRVKPKR